MALDLSQIQGRGGAQRRLTTSRSSTLPTASAEAPSLEVNASMRTAQRGSGGAEELRRIFVGAQDALGSFSDYVQANQDAKEHRLSGEGAAAEAAGIVDPELMKRSRAYRVAVTTGTTERGVNDLQRRTEQRIAERMADLFDPPDLEDIDEIIQGEFQGFATVDGRPRDFGSTEADLLAGRALHALQTRLRDKAAKDITDQVNTRALEVAADNLTDAAKAGTINFEAALSQVPPGVDRKTAKASLIDTASAYAYSVVDEEPDKALGALDALLNSKQSNGTPSLSPKELEALRQQRRTLASQAEAAADRKHREMWEANHDGVLKRLSGVEGSPPTIAELRDMVREDKLDPQTGFRLISSIQSDLEAEARERARDAREAARDAADSPTAAEVSIIDAVFSGKSTPAQASAAANRAAAAGLFGTGKQRYQRLSNVRQNINVVLSMGKAQKDAIKDYVDDWKAEANRVVKERVPDVAKRAQARRDIEQWSKHLMLRGAREAINPSKDALGALRARAGSFSSSLSAKYGL